MWCRGLTNRVAWLGMGCMLAGVGWLTWTWVPWWGAHGFGPRLVRQALSVAADSAATAGRPGADRRAGSAAGVEPQWTAAPGLSVATGQLLGGLYLPALHLTVPLVEGTDSDNLWAAAGHLTASAQPGQPGTCVVAAHNATWFRHLDELPVGTDVVVWTAAGAWRYRVSGHQVVTAGSPLSNTALPSLVLETCYPLNALSLTPNRYLVTAVWAGPASPADLTAAGASQLPPGGWVSSAGADAYYAQLPATLAGPSLTAVVSSLPLAALHYAGQPAAGFEQSARPLAAVHALTQLWAAWLQANSQRDTTALAAFSRAGQGASGNAGPEPAGGSSAAGQTGAASGMGSTPTPLWGVPLSQVTYTQGLTVTLTVNGHQLQQVAGELALRVHGQVWRVLLTAGVAADGALSFKNVTVTALPG
ncbi:MAG: class D sortase [Alicyclobacillus sp.]|nr:class D sortase [Alicyclobacillus sp.]